MDEREEWGSGMWEEKEGGKEKRDGTRSDFTKLSNSNTTFGVSSF